MKPFPFYLLLTFILPNLTCYKISFVVQMQFEGNQRFFYSDDIGGCIVTESYFNQSNQNFCLFKINTIFLSFSAQDTRHLNCFIFVYILVVRATTL